MPDERPSDPAPDPAQLRRDLGAGYDLRVGAILLTARIFEATDHPVVGRNCDGCPIFGAWGRTA